MTEDQHIENFNNKLKEMCDTRSETPFFVGYEHLIEDEIVATLDRIYIKTLLECGLLKWFNYPIFNKKYLNKLKEIGYDRFY